MASSSHVSSLASRAPMSSVIASDDIGTSPFVRSGADAFRQATIAFDSVDGGVGDIDIRGALASTTGPNPGGARLFEDADFPAVARSIEGEKRKMRCRCNAEPKMSYTKSGKNVGRAYFHCATRRCPFFRWAFSAEQMQWYRFGGHNHHILVGPEGFRAEDLVQGKVGDCWFLSALAVIAERADLMHRLFPRLELHPSGAVEVYLFLDGWWRSVLIDNFLPCMFSDEANPDQLRAAVDENGREMGAAMLSLRRKEEEAALQQALAASLTGGDPRAHVVQSFSVNPRFKASGLSADVLAKMLAGGQQNDGGGREGQQNDIHNGNYSFSTTSKGTSSSSTGHENQHPALPRRQQSRQEAFSSSTSGSSALILTSSAYDPFALSDANRQAIAETRDFLLTEREKRAPGSNTTHRLDPKTLSRKATALDLAYSKGNNYQCWVQFLEKAYAKAHGCYQAISGGEVAEAFLDLTGCPTLAFSFDDRSHEPRSFWCKLREFSQSRLPMGCGTSGGGGQLREVGLVGNHAYSILTVKELRMNSLPTGVAADLLRGCGNVSGFGSDGVLRLLKIRNPHGRGEWKGDWSDKSGKWQQLARHLDLDRERLDRSLENDGTFWIDYDHFLMAFSNVDVCLAFPGLYARSFDTNFPQKKDTVRGVQAFEISLPEATRNFSTASGAGGGRGAEVYVMGIQKTRRGAWSGRADRKKSYKQCDVGFLLLFPVDEDEANINQKTTAGSSSIECQSRASIWYLDGKRYRVEGKMLGQRRNGHTHFRLVRRESQIVHGAYAPDAAVHHANDHAFSMATQSEVAVEDVIGYTGNNDYGGSSSSLSSSSSSLGGLFESLAKKRGASIPSRAVVIPLSFGHPAATDKELSYVVRFVCSAAVEIRRLSALPDLRPPIQKFCLQFLPRKILLERAPLCRVLQSEKMGKTVFVYFVVDESAVGNVDVSVEVTALCRGMSCRTAEGLIAHETVAKGERFQAAWRKYTVRFEHEIRSRLLMVLVQSGMDCEMGIMSCRSVEPTSSAATTSSSFLGQSAAGQKTSSTQKKLVLDLSSGTKSNTKKEEEETRVKAPASASSNGGSASSSSSVADVEGKQNTTQAGAGGFEEVESRALSLFERLKLRKAHRTGEQHVVANNQTVNAGEQGASTNGTNKQAQPPPKNTQQQQVKAKAVVAPPKHESLLNFMPKAAPSKPAAPLLIDLSSSSDEDSCSPESTPDDSDDAQPPRKKVPRLEEPSRSKPPAAAAAAAAAAVVISETSALGVSSFSSGSSASSSHNTRPAKSSNRHQPMLTFATPSDQDYAQRGIFAAMYGPNVVNREDWQFPEASSTKVATTGGLPGNIAANLAPFLPAGMQIAQLALDADLERALAISRGETDVLPMQSGLVTVVHDESEIERVLKESARAAEDRELQRALEVSASASASVLPNSKEQDLEEALRLSKLECNAQMGVENILIPPVNSVPTGGGGATSSSSSTLGVAGAAAFVPANAMNIIGGGVATGTSCVVGQSNKPVNSIPVNSSLSQQQPGTSTEVIELDSSSDERDPVVAPQTESREERRRKALEAAERRRQSSG
ncbi:unnamed protein product [Amoebophrya sp. A25]|nr:unnamed protein product [Amoebophrya sp. A25]|eukprot:GSA25T00012572001.1